MESTLLAKLDARFEPAEPTYIEAFGLHHYHLALSVKGAPDKAYSVTYQLHETYTPPQVVSTEEPRFEVHLTSYGDYVVRAQLFSRDANVPIEIASAYLSDLLKRHYQEEGTLTPQIESAINEIRRN